MMATNIPNSKPIEFTRSMLYHPEYNNLTGSGTYPYITDEVDYSETKIGALTYPELIDTFFNRKKFINMVSIARGNPDNKVKPDKQKTLERNVMTMLLLLLPTKYFTVNNHKQSIELLEPGIPTHYKHSIFYNPLKTISSYVKINSKPYTVTEVIWLNDLLNHPTYRTLVEEVYNLNRSLNTYKTELSGKITKFKENINGVIDKISNMISDAIARPKPSGPKDKKAAAAGYASKTNYDALFAIKYLKQLLNNSSVTATAVNAELKKIVKSTVKGPDTNADYNPLPDIFAELNNTVSEFDQNNRLNQILKTMKTQTAVLTAMLKTDDNIENKISLNKLVDALFNISLLDDGITLTNQYNAAKNINLSKQSTAQQTDVPIISQFKFNILYKYKRPALTTENVKLQTYIDTNTPEVAIEWINKFEQIYNKYILKMKDAKLDTDLLSLNVNNINMEKSGTSLPTKEIFIKLTLIDGEVNDTNKSEIYCPVTNNMLGTELLHLIEHRTDNANILNEEDTMFTVNTKTVATSNTNQNPQANQINQLDNKQYNLDNNKLPPNKPLVVTSEASEKFGSTILKSANQRKLDKLIDEIRTHSAPGIQNTTEGILEFINKTYADSLSKNNDQYTKLPDLPSAINEWSKNINRNNTKLQDKLTAMNGELDTNYKIIDDKLKNSKLNGNPADRIKLSSQLANIGLYLYIVELLLSDEKNKKIVATSKGGKVHKKRRHKTIKCKSNPRYKTQKRRNF
jgi:hypothetical protein